MYSEKYRFYFATNKSGYMWGVREVKLKFSIYNSFHSCICKQVYIVNYYLHNSGVLNISSSVQVGDLGASVAMMLLETNSAKQSIFPNKVIPTFRYPVRTYHEEASSWFFCRTKEALFVDITKLLWKTRKLALRPSCHQTLRSSEQFFGTRSIALRKYRQRTRRSTTAASAQLGNITARPLLSASSPRSW